ncbi:MAG: hypothetical protein R6W71_06100, partial [Bacteroidales bacterium]
MIFIWPRTKNPEPGTWNRWRKLTFLAIFSMLPPERSNRSDSCFATGHSVGALAQQLFPGGIDASRG